MDIIKSSKIPINNTTGAKGVYLVKGKYVAKVVFRQKTYYLGTFDDKADAVDSRYYDYCHLYDERIFDDFVLKAKEKQLYNIGAEAKFGDELLTLSTCSYHVDDGRFVVGRKFS